MILSTNIKNNLNQTLYIKTTEEQSITITEEELLERKAYFQGRILEIEADLTEIYTLQQ